MTREKAEEEDTMSIGERGMTLRKGYILEMSQKRHVPEVDDFGDSELRCCLRGLFGAASPSDHRVFGSNTISLRPMKVARLLGLEAAAFLPKRAIQFGSRIARESNRRNFGSNRAANQASAGSVVINMPKNDAEARA